MKRSILIAFLTTEALLYCAFLIPGSLHDMRYEMAQILRHPSHSADESAIRAKVITAALCLTAAADVFSSYWIAGTLSGILFLSLCSCYTPFP